MKFIAFRQISFDLIKNSFEGNVLATKMDTQT